ncbi:MAG: hypothetical protein N4A38_04020 [Candidatus Gracilibacteria bacterium]|nr:hypothetical protein [Candidatus Gracilibacteria bacterium]
MGIFGLSFALNGINKKSGEVLDNLTWTNISSLADKIDVSSSDIKLNGKLYVAGELCSVIGGEKKCLGSCSEGFHWEQNSLSCEDNVLDCTSDKANTTLATKTWNGVDDYGECSVQTCNSGYEIKNNECVKSFNCGVDKYNGYKTQSHLGYCIIADGKTYHSFPPLGAGLGSSFVVDGYLFGLYSHVNNRSANFTYAGSHSYNGYNFSAYLHGSGSVKSFHGVSLYRRRKIVPGTY